MPKATQFELGLIGLGTMGMNLLLNLADRGNVVAGYSRDRSKSAELRELPADNIQGFDDLAEFVAALRIPRVVLLLVPAGPTVDSVVAGLRPLLARGDFIVDAGNSFHRDTTRRIAELTADGIEFVGMGVSGGESGARHGPSMMPGGGQRAWERLGPLLESAAARVGDEPCVAPMGEGAAGHYVKMIHNGIEYALMQMLAECYDLMRRRLGMSNEQMAAEFARWNAGRLQSYLVEITVEVLRTPEPHGAGALVDAVLDRARAKGTGKWSSQDAMDLGVPVPAIDAAVSARELSAYKTERLRLAPLYSDPRRHRSIAPWRWRRWNVRTMRVPGSPTRRAWRRSRRHRRSTGSVPSSPRSHVSGAPAASSAPRSSTRSPPRSRPIPCCRICWRRRLRCGPSTTASTACARRCAWRSMPAFPLRRWPRHSRISTACAAHGCRRT